MATEDKNKETQIRELINEASGLLEKARALSVGLKSERGYGPSFYFDGPDYGMGGHLEDGEWQASSNSC